MARVKDRNRFVPGGYQFLQPQITPNVIGGSDFNSCVQTVLQIRKANPWICQQNNLSTDESRVADEVDEYNAQRCLSQPGWEIYVMDTSPPKSWTPSAIPRLSRRAGGAVGAVRRTAAGIAVVRDWLGAGLKPVNHDLAEGRANTCVLCPQNGNPNWLQTIDAAVAAEIKSLVEIKNDLQLSTSQDANLHTCQACDCHLPLKVHAPLEHILANTSEAVKAKLDDRCWIKRLDVFSE